MFSYEKSQPRTLQMGWLFLERLYVKKKQAHIAPLQPPTLATFLSWGSSAGAGRTDLPLQI